ncbi:hypothetical protein HYDPIDRAFT_27601 [Hydnomerulius pinastri MD-312]|nr:hypothetical protein HYDPIDRAFT_27601 [Hydnomerulius pinastri MD-312]
MALVSSRLPYDVLLLVIEEVYDTGDRGMLVSMAQTCNALSELALNKLWLSLESLVPLVLLFPPELVEVKDAGPARVEHLGLPAGAAVAYLHLRKVPPAEDWVRVMSYARRIKHLRVGDDLGGLVYTHHTTLHTLLTRFPSAFSTDSLLPNLKDLTFENNETRHEWQFNTFGICLRRLLVPSLQQLTFSTGNSLHVGYPLSHVVAEALRRCPKMQYLRVLPTSCVRPGEQLVALSLQSSLGPVDNAPGLMTAQSPSLEVVGILGAGPGQGEIFVTRFTVHIFGGFPSIHTLYLTLAPDDMSPPWNSRDGPNSIFPSLRTLNVRVCSVVAATSFLDAIISTRLEDVYVDFISSVDLRDLYGFVSTLANTRAKLAGLQKLTIRATLLDQTDTPIALPPVPSIVTPLLQQPRAFPQLTALKLKLHNNASDGQGLIRGVDLCRIADEWPELELVKLSTFPASLSLVDVVEFARRLPRLRLLGMDFEDARIPDRELEGGPGPYTVETSALQTLKVRRSPIDDPFRTTTYLQNKLPHLQSIVKSYHSFWDQWEDYVQQWLTTNRVTRGPHGRSSNDRLAYSL